MSDCSALLGCRCAPAERPATAQGLKEATLLALPRAQIFCIKAFLLAQRAKFCCSLQCLEPSAAPLTAREATCKQAPRAVREASHERTQRKATSQPCQALMRT